MSKRKLIPGQLDMFSTFELPVTAAPQCEELISEPEFSLLPPEEPEEEVKPHRPSTFVYVNDEVTNPEFIARCGHLQKMRSTTTQRHINFLATGDCLPCILVKKEAGVKP